MQPGDNFRVVANGDKDFLLNLENNDNTQNTGLSEGEENANKQRICNKDVAGTPAEREVRLAGNYASDTLTVWRFLHVEVDSMKAPPKKGAEANTVEGDITGVAGDGIRATRVFLSVNLETGLTLSDLSANLHSATPGNGRFENGQIIIGTGKKVPGATTTMGLLGNGDTFVRKNDGIYIPALVTKKKQPDVSGEVIAWSGTTFALKVTGGTLSSNYIGGKINVAGVKMDVSGVSTNGGANAVTVSAVQSIPFILHDDDDDNVLPGSVSVTDIQQSDNSIVNKIASVYMRPVYDGGGSITNNQTNVKFVLNTESSSVYKWNSRGNNSQRFWVVYFMAAYQDSYQDLKQDFDANNEGGTWASANNGPMSSGVLFYLESQRDGGLATDWKSRVSVHELGHNFGLMDSYISSAVDGIMHGYAPVGSASSNYFWRPADINTIRSVINPN